MHEADDTTMVLAKDSATFKSRLIDKRFRYDRRNTKNKSEVVKKCFMHFS